MRQILAVLHEDRSAGGAISREVPSRRDHLAAAGGNGSDPRHGREVRKARTSGAVFRQGKGGRYQPRPWAAERAFQEAEEALRAAAPARFDAWEAAREAVRAEISQ